MASAYGSFRMLGSSALYAPVVGSSLLMAFGTNLIVYSSPDGQPSATYTLHSGFVFFSFLFSFSVRRALSISSSASNGSMLLPGLLLGISGMIMQLFGLGRDGHGFQRGADRRSLERLHAAARPSCSAWRRLAIFAFSLVARFVDRRYASMNERYTSCSLRTPSI